MADLLFGVSNPNESSLDLSRKYSIEAGSDLQFDSRGQLIILSGADKIRQYIGKLFLSYQGDNPIDQNYGTTLDSFIGGSISDETSYSLIKQTILDGIAYAVTQYNDSLNDDEKIDTVESFSTKIDTDVSMTTHLIINVELITVSGRTITVGTVI